MILKKKEAFQYHCQAAIYPSQIATGLLKHERNKRNKTSTLISCLKKDI